MNDVVTWFLSQDKKSVVIVGLIVWFAIDFKRRMERDNRDIQQKFQSQLEKTRNLLRTHSEDLGKATKGFEGSFLEIKDEILDFKKELFEQNQDLKDQYARLERKSEMLTMRLEQASKEIRRDV